MKTPKLSLVGYAAGILAIVLSIQRYYITFHNNSQLVLFSGIGVLVIIFSYLYSWMRTIDEKLEELDNSILTILEWKRKGDSKREFEK